MIRELTIAAAIAGAAIALAPSATADPGPMYPDNPGRYPTDTPGMNYEASLGAPCDNYDVNTFGRGPGGESLVCHYIPNQGVKEIGSPCDGPKMAAQAPDGRPMVCLGAQGWQPGTLTGAGFFPG
jgi:hypothetical protein